MLAAVPVRAAEVLAANGAELAAAIGQAQPGDIVTMRDGVWTNADVLFNAIGTETLPITLQAQTPGRVILAGLSRLRIAGSYLVVQGLLFQDGNLASGDVIAFQNGSSSVADHCRLTACSIVDYNPSVETKSTRWVSLYGQSNRVDHCYFTQKRNSGAVVAVWVSSAPDGANYHRIDHNYFGPRAPSEVNETEIIRLGISDVSMSSSRTLVDYNYFKQCSGDVEIISSKSSDNVFRGNVFVECAGTLSLRHGNRCIVEGNYFLGNGKTNTGGVRIMGEEHQVYNNYFADLQGAGGWSGLTLMEGLVDSPLDGYFQVKKAAVAFNTFVNCQNALLIGLSTQLLGTGRETTLPPVDCQIANNLVWTTNGVMIDQRDTPVNLSWEGNLMYGGILRRITNAGISQIDPKLVMATDGAWRPAIDSPALGQARGDYGFVSEDIDGQLRPMAKDIGCDQVSSDPVVHPRLTSAQVGPDWLHAAATDLKWPNPADIVYGTPLNWNQLNVVANVPGEAVFVPGLGTVLAAGAGQVLSVSFSRDDQPDAEPYKTNIVINVLKAPLTIAADDKSRLPNLPNPIFTASYQGIVNGDTPADLALSLLFQTSADVNSAPGNYSIVVAGTETMNYHTTFVNGSLTVRPNQPPLLGASTLQPVSSEMLLSTSTLVYRFLMLQVSSNLLDWADWMLVTNPAPPLLLPLSVTGAESRQFFRARTLAIDLTKWYLTLPVDTVHAGSPDEIQPWELVSYQDPEFFHANSTGDGIVFKAPCGGAATVGSGYPRCELRELTSAGRMASWSTTAGTHTMEVVQAITRLPDVKRDLVAGQIHGPIDDVMALRLEGTKLFVDENGIEGAVLTTNYELGDVFTVKFVAHDGGIDCYYNGAYIYTHATPASGCYFKAGCYTQSNPNQGDAVTASGEVVIYDLVVTHQP